MQCGTILSLLICPSIIRSFSWPSVFFFFGSAGFVWLLAWLPLSKDRAQAPDDEVLPCNKTSTLNGAGALGNDQNDTRDVDAPGSIDAADAAVGQAQGKSDASNSVSSEAGTKEAFDLRSVRLRTYTALSPHTCLLVRCLEATATEMRGVHCHACLMLLEPYSGALAGSVAK